MLSDADRDLIEQATISMATGIMMERDRSTLHGATARLHDMAQRVRISAFDMATVIINTHPLPPSQARP